MADLRTGIDDFVSELNKDKYFFGITGATVAVMMLWQGRIKELGWATNPNWSMQLFTDFISFNAFALILFSYLFISSLASLLASVGHSKPKLEQFVTHIESRLAQITSSICTFIVGFVIVVAGESFLNIDFSGLKLVGLALFFAVFLSGSYLAALMVGRKTAPFDTWWGSVAGMLVVIVIIGYMLLQNMK